MPAGCHDCVIKQDLYKKTVLATVHFFYEAVFSAKNADNRTTDVLELRPFVKSNLTIHGCFYLLFGIIPMKLGSFAPENVARKKCTVASGFFI